MAPPKLKKLFLEDPPTASSSEDEEVEDEEVEEQNPKTPSSDDDEEEEESNDDEEEVEDEEVEVEEQNPKTPSSDNDEEEEESNDDEEEESKPATPPKLKPISSKPKKNVLKPSSSSKSDPKTPSDDNDDEEDDVSEESDSEPPLPKLKPILSKPKKNVSSVTPLKPSATAKKRPLDSEKDSKRKKKKEVDSTHHPEEESVRNTPNTLLFQRVWSDADEIVILKGMIECKKKGVDPLSDLSKFLESIKKSLQVKEFRQEQLREKIHRLKKKFMNKSKRAKGDEDPVLSKPHEQRSYTLMKEIWGGGNSVVVGNGKGDDDSVVVTNVKRSSSRSRKSQNAAGSPVRTKMMMDLDGSNGSLHPCVQEWIYPRNNMNMLGRSFLEQGLDLIGESKRKDFDKNGESKRKDFDKKWRSLTPAEIKLYLRRLELVREEAIAVIDAHKSSDASEHE